MEQLKELELFLNKYFGEKAPALPEGGRKFLVIIAPWICALGIIFGIWGILAILGLGAGSASLLYMGGAYGSAYGAFSVALLLAAILSGATVLFEILAFPGLMKRNYQGWRWLFYSSLFSLVAGVFLGDIAGAIIGAIIGWYLLFQIRSHYAGAPSALAAHREEVPPSQTPSASS